MNFGEALEKLKQGSKLKRQGWNGKNMFIVLMPELYLEADKVNSRTVKHLGEGVDLYSQPYIAMKTADDKWQPGWLASQADILAEDWVEVVVEEKLTETTIYSDDAGSFYLNSGIKWNSTFMRGFPRQGKWSTFPSVDGLWFFGNELQDIKNKDIQKIEIKIKRTAINAQGSSNTFAFVLLRLHDMEVRPYMGSNKEPIFSDRAVRVPLKMGEEITIDVTDYFKEELKQPKWKGFGVSSASTDATNYCALSPILEVKVTYKEEVAE